MAFFCSAWRDLLSQSILLDSIYSWVLRLFSPSAFESVIAAFQQNMAQMESSSLTFALQALLHRHESYMADAEEDRQRFLASIDGLEREKRHALAENARIVEENRGLLKQLDGLNQAVADSDAHVKVLTESLESADAELRKLTVSAARVADLEEQLSMMESEQSKLHETLLSVEEDKKSAVQRWKKAECALRDLHDQVDRIEKEAREERDRHTELVQRLERRRAVERELDGAAGRLKGAAAASELGRNHGGTNVVSRFVRDILQDNANLQIGVMELRDMLHSSNQEVQSLRDQILSHQPLATEGDNPESQLPTLSEELDSKESNRVSREFHIHHHYHTPNSKKDKGSLSRRGKKRRPLQGSLSSLRSASGTQLSQKSRHQHFPSNSSTSTILSQTSVSIPPAASRRWSSQSPADVSIASSPQSNYNRSSIFDRDWGLESSQPTSPESTLFSSPIMTRRHSKGSFDQTFQSLSGLDEIDLIDSGQTNGDDLEHSSGKTIEPVIPEEMQDSLPPEPEDISMQLSRGRSASIDSLFSVAGMDIHTPSTSRLGSLHSTLRMPRRIVSPSLELFSTPAITSTTTITAGPEPPKAVDKSSKSLLASVAAGKNRSDTATVPSTESRSTESNAANLRKTPSLSRRMGGWVKGRWGTAPVSSKDSTPVSDSISSSPSVSKTKPGPESIPALTFRYPGVNQSGPIRGYRPPPTSPSTVEVESLDQNLLNESLAE